MTQPPVLHRHFSTPIVTDRLASAEGMHVLREAIMRRRAEDRDGVQISNIGGWHSDTGMIDWGGEAARALAYKVMTLADRYTVDVRAGGERRFDWMPEMWANVSTSGHANQYHTHPGAFWSAVAYIDDGRRAGEEAGGEILFLDPRMPAIRMTAPDLRIAESPEAVEPNELPLAVETGMLLMFPSWLSHAVRPYRGSGERISIAINLVPVPLPPKSQT